MKRTIHLLIIIAFGYGLVHAAQPAVDRELFTISLNDDTTSIYGCQWNDRVRSTLAGPVLMAGKDLLFYSQNGYVLYTEKGKLIDSYSLIKKNAKAARKGEAPLRLAYPLDSSKLIVYRETDDGSAPTELFQKKLFSKRLKKIAKEEYEIYGKITDGQLFNLAANSITDEMNRRNFLETLLVGYTSLKEGTKWWSIDRLYSFTSPLIVEDQGFCTSFFPGLKSDQKCEIPSHQIEALGVYQLQDRWYYFGIASSFGNTADAYYQMVVLCDQAGNLLYNNKIIKQEIGDAVLQHVEKTNTNFTVRRAVRHVFVPAITRQGDICYGMIDYSEKKIVVYKRRFLRYVRKPAKKIGASDFVLANEYAYSPLLLDCVEGESDPVHPEVTRMTDDGLKPVDKDSLVRDGYYVTVQRVTDDALKKKMMRTQAVLPEKVQHAQDSMARIISAWCPYSVAINHKKKGRLNYLHYGMSDELLSARVLEATDTSGIFVRIDCEQWAEVVQFAPDGAYLNRFIFSTQDYTERKDLITVFKNGVVAEQDWENDSDKPAYFTWQLQ